MISAWHLLWIIPLSNIISIFTLGLCGVGAKSDNLSEAYSIGFRDGKAYRDKEMADESKA